MPEPTRKLNNDEAALLLRLLDGDWVGASEAKNQLATARRTSLARADLDFDLSIDETLALIPAPDGILQSTDQLVYRDGTCIAGVMIWVDHGRLASFEYYLLTDLDYDRLPSPAEIRRA